MVSNYLRDWRTCLSYPRADHQILQEKGIEGINCILWRIWSCQAVRLLQILSNGISYTTECYTSTANRMEGGYDIDTNTIWFSMGSISCGVRLSGSLCNGNGTLACGEQFVNY